MRFAGKLQLTLKAKLMLGFASITFIFLLVALYNAIQMQHIQEGAVLQREKTSLQLQALEMKGHAQDIKDIASGLMISRKPEFVEKYKQQRSVFQESVKRVGDTAVTEEQMKWRSQLIMASTDYLNMFDQAVSIISDKSLKEIDIQKNTEYLYQETQKQRDKIFELVDLFYSDYSQAASEATASSDELLASARSVMNGATLFVLILSVAISLLIMTAFSRNIRKLQEAVAVISKGDLSHKIGSEARDELGVLSRSFDDMVDKVRDMLIRTKDVAASLSSHSERFERFSEDTAAANSSILKTIHEIAAGADLQAQSSESSTVIIDELDKEMEIIWQSAEAMRVTSLEAGGNTEQGQEAVEGLRRTADETEETIRQVRGAIRQLAESSRQIGKIVNTITEISTQTNILSLNAAIEAARAGAAGKGFSVIAEEVRVLSQETNESSKSIAQYIGSLQGRVKELESSMDKALEMLSRQNVQVEITFRAFGSIDASMQEVAGQISSIYEKVELAKQRNQTLVATIQHVAAVAEETAAGVQEVTSTSVEQDASIRHIAEQASDIRKLSAGLFEEISRFRLEEEDQGTEGKAQAENEQAGNEPDGSEPVGAICGDTDAAGSGS